MEQRRLRLHGQRGGHLDFNNGTVYVFNNTVFNCTTGIGKNSDVTGEVRNNVSINDALNAAFTDYFQLAGPPASPAAATSLPTRPRPRTPLALPTARPPTPPTSRTRRAGDFHLLNTSLSLWTANGTDLSAHANLPVTNDIDGGPRVRPDIGADELAAVPVYYSVGTAAGPLYSANASATSGVLTLASAAANNVGVGDEVRLGVDSRRSPLLHYRPRLIDGLHDPELSRHRRHARSHQHHVRLTRRSRSAGPSTC